MANHELSGRARQIADRNIRTVRNVSASGPEEFRSFYPALCGSLGMTIDDALWHLKNLREALDDYVNTSGTSLTPAVKRALDTLADELEAGQAVDHTFTTSKAPGDITQL